MKRIRYIGGHDAVEIDGGPTVKRGEAFDAGDALAAALLAQPGNFEPAKTTRKPDTEEQP